MAEYTLDKGRDAYVASDRDPANPARVKQIRVAAGSPAALGFVQMSRLQALVRGKRVESAVLRPRAARAMDAQTMTVTQPVKYDLAKLKWKNRPNAQPGQVQADIDALAAGERGAIELAPLVQKIADGQPDYGFRLATSSGDRLFWGFNASLSSWILDLKVLPPSDAPTNLTPSSGIVGVRRPILTWTPSDGQDQYQVEITRPGVIGATYATGTVDSRLPSCNLATTAYAGAIAGESTMWRVRTRKTGEDWSDWSDWVGFIYEVQPTLVFTSPAGSTVTDATPVLTAASTNGAVFVRSQLVVRDVTGVLVYQGPETAIAPSAEVGDQVPVQAKTGKPVLEYGRQYDAAVRGWTSDERRTTPGASAYAEVVKRITIAPATGAAPVLTAVRQQGPYGHGPGMLVSISRGATPDGWVLQRAVGHRDGWGEAVTVQRYEFDVATLGDSPVKNPHPGVYQWPDMACPLSGRVRHRVAAITDGVTSKFSPWVESEPVLYGAWVVRANGQAFMLENDEISSELLERRTTLSPPGLEYDIDIVTALGGLVGEIAGTIDTLTPVHLDDALQILAELRGSTEVVRIMHRAMNKPCTLRAIDYDADPERWTPERRCHAVSFGFQQVGEFDSTLGG